MEFILTECPVLGVFNLTLILATTIQEMLNPFVLLLSRILEIEYEQ